MKKLYKLILKKIEEKNLIIKYWNWSKLLKNSKKNKKIIKDKKLKLWPKLKK